MLEEHMEKAFSAREFNQNLSEAKRIARYEPVFVTDRGKPAFVLLSVDEYKRLTRAHNERLLEVLVMEDADIEFETPRPQIEPRPVEL